MGQPTVDIDGEAIDGMVVAVPLVIGPSAVVLAVMVAVSRGDPVWHPVVAAMMLVDAVPLLVIPAVMFPPTVMLAVRLGRGRESEQPRDENRDADQEKPSASPVLIQPVRRVSDRRVHVAPPSR